MDNGVRGAEGTDISNIHVIKAGNGAKKAFAPSAVQKHAKTSMKHTVILLQDLPDLFPKLPALQNYNE